MLRIDGGGRVQGRNKKTGQEFITIIHARDAGGLTLRGSRGSVERGKILDIF